MAVPDQRVVLQGNLNHHTIESMVARVQPMLHVEEPVHWVLDLTGVTFVTPAAMGVLRAAVKNVIAKGMTQEGSGVVLPSNAACAQYVRRMDVLDGLVQWQEPEGFNRQTAVTFTPVQSFTGIQAAESAARDALGSIAASGTLSHNLSALVAENVVELTENAVAHSVLTGDGEGTICTQFWPGSGIIEVVVVDLGLGVPATVRTNSEHVGLDDLAAMRVAMQRGGSRFTRDAEPNLRNNRGKGLWGLSEVVRENGGSLTIVSYGSRIDVFAGGQPAIGESSASFPGTLAVLRLNVARQLDLPMDIDTYLDNPPSSGVVFD